jgi:hypothetical protein
MTAAAHRPLHALLHGRALRRPRAAAAAAPAPARGAALLLLATVVY